MVEIHWISSSVIWTVAPVIWTVEGRKSCVFRSLTGFRGGCGVSTATLGPGLHQSVKSDPEPGFSGRRPHWAWYYASRWRLSRSQVSQGDGHTGPGTTPVGEVWPRARFLRETATLGPGLRQSVTSDPEPGFSGRRPHWAWDYASRWRLTQSQVSQGDGHTGPGTTPVGDVWPRARFLRETATLGLGLRQSVTSDPEPGFSGKRWHWARDYTSRWRLTRSQVSQGDGHTGPGTTPVGDVWPGARFLRGTATLGLGQYQF